MSINLSTFWTTWGVSSGDTTSTNQYDFWRGLIMNDGTIINSQYDFFKWNNTTRYQFFNNLNSTYPEIWDETTFYQNTNDPRIYDAKTFYTYAAESLPGGGPVPPTFYSEDFNCTNPFNSGQCGCLIEGLTTSYLACEDYVNQVCHSTFYWTGANPSEPEIGDTLYSTASESTPLTGGGTFWLADGNSQSYQVDNSGVIIDKYACEPLRQINLLGQFSSWSGGYVLTTTDNVNYIYSGASLPGGGVKFRQDDSWTINWGSTDWPSGIGYQDGPNIPSQGGNWLVTFNRLTGAYDFVPVLDAAINPSFTIVNENVTLYATTSYPTGAVYTWELTDFFDAITDEPITSFTGDTVTEGYFTSSGSSNVTLTIVNGTQTATTSSFQICPFAVSGSITPSSAYTNTNVILSGSSNYDGGYVDYTWYLTDFYDAGTDEPITYYNGQVLPEGYFTSTGDTNVQLYISSCGNPAIVGIDVYEQPIPMNASGGTITTYTSGGTTYRVHTFTSNGTFTVNTLGSTAGNIDVLLVGGGGKGGSTYGSGAGFREIGAGGGGAGGAIFTSTTVTTTSYNLVIGSAGTSGNGGNTSGFTRTAFGGGVGGDYFVTPGNGGSGGGARSSQSAGTGTAGQGNNGGGASTSQRGTGAGGGAGAVGQTGQSSGAGANGGNGIQVDITGTLLYYAGGGGAGRSNFTTAGSGGQGGGGNGGANSADNGFNATFYGGGGGGAGEVETGSGAGSGGNGYQGVIIIRYPI